MMLILFDRIAALVYFFLLPEKKLIITSFILFTSALVGHKMQGDASCSGSVPKLELLRTTLSKSYSLLTVISSRYCKISDIFAHILLSISHTYKIV